MIGVSPRDLSFVYQLARTTFLSQPVFIFNAKTFNKSVFFIDETTDKIGRKIINVLVGILEEGKCNKPKILDTTEINELNDKTLGQTIVYEVCQICISVEFENFKLLLTDAALYCKKLDIFLTIASLKA
jgi:hypothetical protein